MARPLTPVDYMLPDVGSTDMEAYYETAEAEFMALQDLSSDADINDTKDTKDDDYGRIPDPARRPASE